MRGVAGPGGGSPAVVPVPIEWRGTTRQVCGLYPWSAPGQLPMSGVPIGRHQSSGAVVCFDHVSWFRANRISNPSMLILARPGLGKSTLAAKIMLGLSAAGYLLLIPGDTKPDYVELTRALGGRVATVRRSGGAALNPCDPGGMAAAASRIGGPAGEALASEAIGRATVAVSGLVELSRKGQPVADYEEAAVSAGLRLAAGRLGRPPVLPDLLALFGDKPDEVRAVVLDRRSDDTYDTLLAPLQRSLLALLNGSFGDVFARCVDRSAGEGSVPESGIAVPAVDIDTSQIKGGDAGFLAAVLMAAWSETYGQVEAAQALADAGLAPRRRYCLCLDELWRVLNLGGSMPDRVNELTRLNRTQGVGQIMITHSIRDLAGSGRANVEGIEERAGAIVVGGVPKAEVTALDKVLTLTDAERRAVRSWWSDGGGFAESRDLPPGAGKFLIKPSSEDPGIPVDVVLTSAERAWGGQNTNRAWDS